MGMAGIVMSVAPAAGPVAAGMIIDSMGWRAMFWSIAPLGVIVLAASVFLLSNVGELKNPRLDMPSVLLSTAAFGGLLYGFSSASSLGWTNPVVIAVILVGALCPHPLRSSPEKTRRTPAAARHAEIRCLCIFGYHCDPDQLRSRRDERHAAYFPAERPGSKRT